MRCWSLSLAPILGLAKPWDDCRRTAPAKRCQLGRVWQRAVERLKDFTFSKHCKAKPLLVRLSIWASDPTNRARAGRSARRWRKEHCARWFNKSCNCDNVDLERYAGQHKEPQPSRNVREEVSKTLRHISFCKTITCHPRCCATSWRALKPDEVVRPHQLWVWMLTYLSLSLVLCSCSSCRCRCRCCCPCPCPCPCPLWLWLLLLLLWSRWCKTNNSPYSQLSGALMWHVLESLWMSPSCTPAEIGGIAQCERRIE